MVAAWITTVWARSDHAWAAPRAHQAQIILYLRVSVQKSQLGYTVKKSFFLKCKKSFLTLCQWRSAIISKSWTHLSGSLCHGWCLPLSLSATQANCSKREGYLAHICKPSSPNPNSEHCRHKQPAPGKSQPERILQASSSAEKLLGQIFQRLQGCVATKLMPPPTRALESSKARVRSGTFFLFPKRMCRSMMIMT